MIEYLKGVDVILLENSYFTSQIVLAAISCILLIATFVYGIMQYNSQKKHMKIIKAAELARMYEEDIIPGLSLIVAIIESTTPIASIMEKIEKAKKEKFDQKELESILTNREIQTIKRFSEIVLCSNDSYKIKKDPSTKNEQDTAEDEEDDYIKLIDKDSLVNVINRLMNRLEYFSIHFKSGVADDNTVYQSLHQTLFITINYIYVFIALQNKPNSGKDKLYTNTISLYNKWEKIHNKQKKKEEKMLKKINKMEKDIVM